VAGADADATGTERNRNDTTEIAVRKLIVALVFHPKARFVMVPSPSPAIGSGRSGYKGMSALRRLWAYAML
jgi:hypothetical protein